MDSISDLNALALASLKSTDAVADIIRQLIIITGLFEGEIKHIEEPSKRRELDESITELKQTINGLQNGTISIEEGQKVIDNFTQKYGKIEIDEALYPHMKPYLEQYDEEGRISCYKIDRLTDENTFTLYYDKNDQTKINEILTISQNSMLNKEELSKEELKEFSVGEKIVEAKGLTIYDIEMLREKQNNFKYSVDNTENGPVIYISDKNRELAESVLNKNRESLDVSITGDFHKLKLIENTKTRELIGENVSSKNNKTIYLCDRTKDRYIKISDHDFEEYQNGKLVASGVKKDRDDFEYLNDSIKTFGDKVIIEEEDFEKEFEKRVAKEKTKEDYMKLISGQRPVLDYEKHLLEEKKLDNYKSIENFGRTTLLYEFTNDYLDAVRTGQFNEEKQKELFEHYKELDLDEKGDIIKIFSGLSANEIQTLNNHLETFIEERDIEEHIEFIEVETEKFKDKEENMYEIEELYEDEIYEEIDYLEALDTDGDGIPNPEQDEEII